MALSIRNASTEDAVRALAAQTGLSLTEAIDRAVRAELARLDDSAETLAVRRREIHEMTERLRARINPDNFLTDDDLYDERGLPR